MLKAHLDAVEKHLLEIARIPANSGHTLHKGTPREAFIKDFLASHLSERVAIGTGEIIDANSRAGQQRNQIDIIIYKRDYPKIDFGGGISGFLVESVVATIEVKSVLTKAELEKAIRAAHSIKALHRKINVNFFAGYQPPGILSYVVAYEGPASMGTVHSWIPEIHASLGIIYPPLGTTREARIKVASPSIDAVFVLGKGFMHFENTPISFITNEALAKNPEIKWSFADASDGNLLFLFIMITNAVTGVSLGCFDLVPYLSSYSMVGRRYMHGVV